MELTPLPTDGTLLQAQWLTSERYVAYDADNHAWEVLDVNGHVDGVLATTAPELDQWITPSLHASPRGQIVILEHWQDNTLSAFSPATLQEQPLNLLPGLNDVPRFSPDGSSFLYRNRQGDDTSLVIASSSGAESTVIRTATGQGAYLSPISWSPDGSWLLVGTATLGEPCARGPGDPPDPDCFSFATSSYDVLDLSGNVLWRLDSDGATTVQWWSVNRLLLASTDNPPRLVDISDHTEMVLPYPLADLANVIVAISPQGTKAILVRPGGDCSFVDLQSPSGTQESSVPCGSVSWSADSTRVLISGSGN